MKIKTTAQLKLPSGKRKPFKEIGRRAIPAAEVGGKVQLRALVDRASLELFVNDGQAAGSFTVVPDGNNRTLLVTVDATTRISALEVNELKSSWTSK